jgi:hypothetical protein
VVLLPAVVSTLLHAVETKPLPLGCIFFVALLGRQGKHSGGEAVGR